MGGDEDVVGDRIVASGGPQSRRVPGVEDLHLARRDADRPQDGWSTFCFLTRDQDASAKEVLGVGDTAAERPTSGYQEAAVDWSRSPARRPYPCGDRTRVAEGFDGALLWQVAGEQAAGDRDGYAPSGRSVAASDGLRAFEGDAGWGLGSAQRAEGTAAHQ